MAVLLCVRAGIGCSAGASVAVIPISTATPLPAGTSSLNVSVYLPNSVLAPSLAARGARARRVPLYLPSTIGSLAFVHTLSGGAPVSAPAQVVVVGSGACTAVGVVEGYAPNGQTCSTTLVGALGQNQWTVESFASTNGSGVPLSRATIVKSLGSGQVKLTTLTFDPVLAGIAFTPQSASCAVGRACVQRVTLNALDATGATIVGGQPFVNPGGAPLTISLSAPPELQLRTASGAPALTAITRASDIDLATVTYSGSASVGSLVVTATAGIHSATYTLEIADGAIKSGSSSDTVNLTSNQPVAVTIFEPGYTGQFFFADNCLGVAEIGVDSANGPTAEIPLVQVGGGTCSILVTDDHGGSASIDIVSTTFSVGVN